MNATVLEYHPKDFSLGTPEAALDYLKQKEQGSDFVLSDVLREVTGVEEIERQSEEQKIEHRALERVATIQKDAFDEGYKLGKDEGFKAAFDKKNSEIVHGLEQVDAFLKTVEVLKMELVSHNEAHIVKLIYQIAEKIAFDHIQAHPEVVLSVIKKSIEIAQADEDVNVLVAPEQIEFLENMKHQTGRENEFLKNVKLQSSENVQPGGCIVETNYGIIDARVEERIGKLWEEIRQATPKVKSSVG